MFCCLIAALCSSEMFIYLVFFAYLSVFCSRQCLAKILFFLGLVFEIHFRERTFAFVTFLRSSVFFGGVLPMFLHICWVLCSRECWIKIIFFLGLVFEIHFRERTFVFCCLVALLCFSVVFCLCFYKSVGFFVPKNAWQKFSSS